MALYIGPILILTIGNGSVRFGLRVSNSNHLKNLKLKLNHETIRNLFNQNRSNRTITKNPNGFREFHTFKPLKPCFAVWFGFGFQLRAKFKISHVNFKVLTFFNI